eukprot:scaffold203773_cov17-Tisochrysis_lutea.AAC.4
MQTEKTEKMKSFVLSESFGRTILGFFPPLMGSVCEWAAVSCTAYWCRFSTVGLVALPALASSGQRPPELSKRAARYSFAMPFSFPSHTHQGFPQLSFRRSKDAGHAAYFRRISRGQAGKGDFPPIAPTLLCAPPVEPSTQRHVIAFAAQAVNRSVVRPSIRVQAQRAG